MCAGFPFRVGFTSLCDCTRPFSIAFLLHNYSQQYFKPYSLFMRQIITSIILIALAAQVNAQGSRKSSQFGFKAGYNVARMTGTTTNFKPDSKNGFMASVFFAPAAKTGIGYRSELVFSRQGFGFSADGKKTNVTSDYVYLPQFTTIGITKYFQLQIGGQLGYLLKSDQKTEGSDKKDLGSLMNKLDYGAAAGVEIYPIKGLIIGGRYNMSFGNAYKTPEPTANPLPMPMPLPFNPSEVKGKNAVINFYLGYKF